MLSLILDVLKPKHRCDWETCSVNKWMIPIEQFCRGCGGYRHHLFADYRGFDEPNWRSGKHPNQPKD